MFVHADRIILSKNIRYLRKRKKLSRAKFAQYVKMSAAQLYCIERGMYDFITWDALHSISETFGIPEQEIVSDDLEEKYKGKRFHYSR